MDDDHTAMSTTITGSGYHKAQKTEWALSIGEQLFKLEGHKDPALIDYIVVLMDSGKTEAKIKGELETFMSSRQHCERLVGWLFSSYPLYHGSTHTNSTVSTVSTGYAGYTGHVNSHGNSNNQLPTKLKSVVSLPLDAKVVKPTTMSTTTRPASTLRAVVDSVVRSNMNIHNNVRIKDPPLECRDARDIILQKQNKTRPVRTTVIMNQNAVTRTKTASQQPEPDHHMQMHPQKTLKRCPDFPNCELSAEQCPNVHPTEICKYFPNCMFGKDCLYIHPPVPCRFGTRCTNPLCNFTHDTTNNNNTNPPPAALNIMCKFGARCQRPNCPFLHPVNMPCPHGAQCIRPACPFTHPVDHAAPAPKSMINRPCRFGKFCAKADCPYQHVNKENIGSGNVVNMVSNANAGNASTINPCTVNTTSNASNTSNANENKET